MAVFCNQAAIRYGTTVRQSNIACGEIVETVRMTKTALIDTYDAGSVLTYIVNIANDGETPLSNLTFTDDLGAYSEGSVTYTPLSYVDGSMKVFADGTEQPAPVVTGETDLTAEGIDVPANGSTTLIYAARVNEYAPLGEDEEGDAETIVNTASLTGVGIAQAVTASATVSADVTPDLTIAKSICPSAVTENSRVTYTFVIANTGGETAEEDGVVLTDTFNPVLTDLAVTMNGQVLAEGTGYTYDETNGEFATADGAITVPGAVYTQDEETGVWTTEPGTVTLTISGYLGAVTGNPEPPIERNAKK
jgi:uncharacterized repeat protein (TIGR01451 family)